MSGEELRNLLRAREDVYAQELVDLQADDLHRHRVVTSAAAKRRRAAWGKTAVAAAVIGAVSLGAWVFSGSRPDAVPISPPSESPAPSQSAAPDDVTFPAPLPVDGFFLEAERLTQTVWTSVGDGWTLTYWQPSRQASGDAGRDVTDPGKAAIYVMSPQGVRYEVSHFDALPHVAILSIAFWEPGMMSALVEVSEDDDTTTWQWLDFQTGQLDPNPTIPGGAFLLGWTPSETLVFRTVEGVVSLARDGSWTTLLDNEQDEGATLSPDGTTIVGVQRGDEQVATVITAYSATTGRVEWTFEIDKLRGGAIATCDVDGWAGPALPAVVCQDVTGADSALVAGPAIIYAVGSGGATEIFAHESPLQWSHVQVAADGIIATGADPMAQGLGPSYYLDSEPLQQWSASSGDAQLAHVQVVGDSEIATWYGGDLFASTTARDVATGASFDVTPSLDHYPEWSSTTHAAVLLVGAVGSPS